MRLLASFVIVCLGLLIFVAWLVARDRPPAFEASHAADSPQGQVGVSSEAVCRPAESQAAQLPETPEAVFSAGSHEPEEESGLLAETPTSVPAPTTQCVSEKRPVSRIAPIQTGVRWADESPSRRLVERYRRLRETLLSDPYNEAALHAAFELAGRLERHQEACELLARLVRLRGDDVDLRFELGTMLMRLQRWLEAIPQLRYVVERQPGNARAWYNLAIAHQAFGHLHDAKAAWDRAIELLPDNASAYAHRGEVLLDLQHWPAATEDFEAVLRYEPDSLDAAMNLSLALSKLGRYQEAHVLLLPLIQEFPQHVTLLNRLAELAWTLYQANPQDEQKMCEQAIDCWSRSLAVKAEQPQVRAMLERLSEGGS